MNKTNIKLGKLENEKVSKLVLSFFMTTFIGLILNSIYNLTDTLFVSWGVGDVAMGGVSLIVPFVMIQGAISTMIGGGAASLVSRKLGEGSAEEAGNITRNAMIVFYTVSIVITVLCFIFMKPLLNILGATEELYPYARDYFSIILIGNVFSTGFSAIMRAEGKMVYSMVNWILPITINIILDAIFILGLGWGVKGSAAATIISQFVGFLMCILFFTKFSIQKFKNSKFNLKTIGKICNIGLPSLAQMGSLSIIIAVLNVVLSKSGGTVGVVAFGYISKLIIFATAPLIAITQALAPIVGFNYGLGRHDRVKLTVSFCIKISILYVVVAIALAEAIPNYLLMAFTNDSTIIEVGSLGIRIIALSLLFMPLPMIIGAKFQAMGKTLMALVVSCSNAVFIVLPIIFLSQSFGTVGAWWSYVIAYLCSTIFVLIIMLINKLKKNSHNNLFFRI